MYEVAVGVVVGEISLILNQYELDELDKDNANGICSYRKQNNKLNL